MHTTVIFVAGVLLVATASGRAVPPPGYAVENANAAPSVQSSSGSRAPANMTRGLLVDLEKSHFFKTFVAPIVKQRLAGNVYPGGNGFPQVDRSLPAYGEQVAYEGAIATENSHDNAAALQHGPALGDGAAYEVAPPVTETAVRYRQPQARSIFDNFAGCPRCYGLDQSGRCQKIFGCGP